MRITPSPSVYHRNAASIKSGSLKPPAVKEKILAAADKKAVPLTTLIIGGLEAVILACLSEMKGK